MAVKVNWRHRMPAWAYTVVIVLLVGGVVLVAVHPWSRSTDPREYPESGPVGAGNLERDLLPRYHVSLPCEVRDLRYGDSSAEELYLRFTTSSACLEQFLTANALTRDPAGARLLQIPEQYGWTFAADDDWYIGSPDPSNQVTVAVDLGTPDPTVYLIADHAA